MHFLGGLMDPLLYKFTVVKKMRFQDHPRVQKNHVMGPIPQITSVLIPEQNFLSARIESQNQKLLPLGSDAKF